MHKKNCNTDQPIILSVPKWLKTKAYLSHEPLHISEQEEDIFHLSLVALHELASAHMCTCTLLKLALSVHTRAWQDTFPGNCIKRGNPSATDVSTIQCNCSCIFLLHYFLHVHPPYLTHFMHVYSAVGAAVPVASTICYMYLFKSVLCWNVFEYHYPSRITSNYHIICQGKWYLTITWKQYRASHQLCFGKQQ